MLRKELITCRKLCINFLFSALVDLLKNKLKVRKRCAKVCKKKLRKRHGHFVETII